MRRVVRACAAFAAGFALSVSRAPTAGTLIPRVQSDVPSGAAVALPHAVRFSTSSSTPRMLATTSFLQDQLLDGGYALGPVGLSIRLQRFGQSLPAGGLPAGVAPFAAIGEEGYALSVSNLGAEVQIVVGASTDHGLWNGAMTALQLLLTDAKPAGAEPSIVPRLILDYPDAPMRASYVPSTFPIDRVTGAFALTDTVKARIDELARMKENTLFDQSDLVSMNDATWQDPPLGRGARTAYAALQQYCDARFIELVPDLGTLALSPDIAHRDGWFIRDEPFQFVATPPQYLAQGSFDEDLDLDGLPDGWKRRDPDQPFAPAFDSAYGTWTHDHTRSHTPSDDGSMRIAVPNAPCGTCPATQDSANLVLIQTIPLPGSAPATYRVEAWFWAPAPGLLGGGRVELELSARDADHQPLASVKAVLNPGEALAGWTREFSASGIALNPAVDGSAELRVTARMLEPGYGTVYLDDVRVTRDGDPATVYEAVGLRSHDNLLDNAGLEVDANADGIPDGWTVDPAGPSFSGTWTRDPTAPHGGQFAMHLARPDGAQNSPSLSREVSVSLPGNYLLSAWLRATVTGQYPQLTFYAIGTDPDHAMPITTNGTGLDPYLENANWSLRQAVIHIPDSVTSADFRIYARVQAPGIGDFWIDDVSLRRVNGELDQTLRNTTEIRVAPAPGASPYLPGSQFQVIDGPLRELYDHDGPPTRLRLTAGSAIPVNSPVYASFDKNLFYTDDGKQGPNLCSIPVLSDAYAKGIQNLLVDLPSLSGIPVRTLDLDSDELRGMNRAGACFGANGAQLQTNGALLARAYNTVEQLVHAEDPEVRLFAFDDMLSPVHNGANPYGQLATGGPYGMNERTACAADPSICYGSYPPSPAPPVATTSIGMMNWWYAREFYQRDASARFFAQQNREQLFAPWNDPLAIRDWAAMLPITPRALGLLGTGWFGDESGLPLTLELAWNLESEQVFYANFEALTFPGYAFAGGAAVTRVVGAGTCAFGEDDLLAAYVSHNGGLCAPAGSSISLPWIAAENSGTYEVQVMAKAPAPVPVTYTFHWLDAANAERTTAVAGTLGGGSDFTTGGVSAIPTPSGTPSTQLRLEIGTSGALKLDDVKLRRSRGACPNGRVVAVVPAVINLGTLAVGASYPVSVLVQNQGCEDLRIGSLSTSPSGKLVFSGGPLPRIVRAGTSLTLAATGSAPPLATGDSYVLSLGTNAAASPSVAISLATNAATQDLDGDGRIGSADNCPAVANANQSDADGDGIGDVCQCGDVSGNGRISSVDVDVFRTYLSRPTTSPLSAAAQSKCRVDGDTTACDVLQLSVLRRTLAAPPLAPGIVQLCTASGR